MTVSARTLLASALALIAGLAVGVGLVAARGNIETNAVIFFTEPNTFNGAVTSPVQKCIPQRRVRVKRVRNGRPDRVVGEDTTKANGFFKTVIGEVRGGGYYAAVKRREVNAGVCAPVHSNTTTVTAKTAR